MQCDILLSQEVKSLWLWTMWNLLCWFIKATSWLRISHLTYFKYLIDEGMFPMPENLNYSFCEHSYSIHIDILSLKLYFHFAFLCSSSYLPFFINNAILSFKVTGFLHLPLHGSREQLQYFGCNETAAFHRSLEGLKMRFLPLLLFDLKKENR